jgi:O-antigen/teichoic acid export membrane protein
MMRLRVKRPPLREGDLVRESLKDHWKYGRWSIANRGLGWVPHNAFYILLPIWGGLEAGASFRALMNLFMPVLQANNSISVLLLPAFVRARERPTFGSRVGLAMIPFVLVSVVYWVVLGIFHAPIIDLIYGGQYTEYAYLIWLLGLVPIAGCIKEVMAHSLRALERPDRLFLAYVFSAVVTGTLGALCVYLWGVAGAGAGLILAHGSAAILVAMLLMVLCRQAFGSFVTVQEDREGR